MVKEKRQTIIAELNVLAQAFGEASEAREGGRDVIGIVLGCRQGYCSVPQANKQKKAYGQKHQGVFYRSSKYSQLALKNIRLWSRRHFNESRQLCSDSHQPCCGFETNSFFCGKAF